MKMTVPLLLALCSCACGGEGSSGDGGQDGGPPVCTGAELRVRGTLDGVGVDQRAEVAGQYLVNTPGDLGCYMNVYMQAGGRLRLEWPETLPVGTSRPASGSVNLEAQGGINVGNCSGGELVSELTLREDGVDFTLRQLHRAPYCGGESVAGELAGCANFKQ